jgi:hypothetical protein
VYVAGGLAEYHGVLTHFAVLIPHSASVPGALTAGDLPDLAAALAPRPLRLEGLVDHRNVAVGGADLKRVYAPATQAYGGAAPALSLSETRSSPAGWLVEQLK